MPPTFGMSRLVEGSVVSGDSTKNGPGPVRWMAPEAIRIRRYSSQTDVYSFRVLTWEVFADGAVPFGDIKSLADVVVKKTSDQVSLMPPAGTPTELGSMMRCMWSYSPHERPSMDEVSHKIDHVINH
jgi:serine/threonine protein kinase